MLEALLNLDGGFLLFLQENVRNPVLSSIMIFITSLGDEGMIGFSRLYVGVHYPTDVIAGIIMGIFLSYLAQFLVDQMTARISRT